MIIFLQKRKTVSAVPLPAAVPVTQNAPKSNVADVSEVPLPAAVPVMQDEPKSNVADDLTSLPQKELIVRLFAFIEMKSVMNVF